MLRRTTALAVSILALTGTLASPAFVGWETARADDTFIGEDLGLDLYRKVDKGIGNMKFQTVSKRIKGNAKKLNSEERLGTKICRNVTGGKVPCFDEGDDFTLEELDAIENGSAAPIWKHLSKDVAATTDTVASIVSAMKKYSSEAKSEAGNQVEAFGRMGSIGLFADGSVENSSYDLMKDLENIHAIVFAKDIPYGGIPNDAAESIMNALEFNTFLGDTPNLPQGTPGFSFPQDTAARPGSTPISTPPTTLTPSTISASALCSSGSEVAGIDAALAADLANQLKYGSNNASAGSAASLSGATASGALSPLWKRNAGKNSESMAFDSSNGCTGFFCINVDFIMYDSLLLWGGKTYSVESILDQNFKIVKEFAGTSFVQAQHTNNFFELLLKNLNLPSLAHLGVVVSTLPPPMLNLDPSNTPRGQMPVSSAEKEYKEVTNGVFKDFWIDFKKQNDLQNKEVDQMVRNLEALPTDVLNEKKLSPAYVPRGNYFASKESSLRSSYSDSFSNDLLEFRGFTLTFIEHLESLTALSKKFRDIPSEK